MRNRRIKTILFLQLPRPDTDVRDMAENVHLAGIYLRHVIENSIEKRWLKCLPFIKYENIFDDKHLIEHICKMKPDIIAVTLYVWNIERTLSVLKAARSRIGAVKMVAGGPEVDKSHPFLPQNMDIDVLVSGEGEGVLPSVLANLYNDRKTDLSNVAWRTHAGFVWGTKVPPYPELSAIIPKPDVKYYFPDRNGIAWLETVRGCPLRCSFCAYGHGRPKPSSLTAEDVKARVMTLIKKGAKAIRFIDPAFNANTDFREIMFALKDINKNKKVRFFAEIRPDTLTREEAYLLALSNFTEIEAGVQSRNKKTLSLLKRYIDIGDVERGIKYLLTAGIQVTVDLMFGLPGQTLNDIKESLEWAKTLKGAHIQCLDTLLIPGTPLRAAASEHGLSYMPLPPYSVTSTHTMNENEITAASKIIEDILDADIDSPTDTFVGKDIPGIYTEKVFYHLSPGLLPGHVKGRTNKRAVFLNSKDILADIAAIKGAIETNVATEPHILWQFVLVLEKEAPLSLIDTLASALKRLPYHFIDRSIHIHSPGKICSRKIFIQLKYPKRFSAGYISEAENILRKYFF